DARPAFLALPFRGNGHALVLVVGKHCLEYITGRQLAAADGCQYILHVLSREPVQHRLQAFLGEGLVVALESALENALTKAGILLANGVLGGAPDGSSGLARDDDGLPGGWRHLRLGADNLYFVAVLELCYKRHDSAVHLRADGRVPDIGVDRIGEVD